MPCVWHRRGTDYCESLEGEAEAPLLVLAEIGPARELSKELRWKSPRDTTTKSGKRVTKRSEKPQDCFFEGKAEVCPRVSAHGSVS